MKFRERGGDNAAPSVDKYLRASSERGLLWERAEGRDIKLCPRDAAIGQEHRPQARGWTKAGGQACCEEKLSRVNKEGNRTIGLLLHVE